ncbi:MAG: methionyl-tRNA formyltransferase [Pseudomonadota bacterium]
MLKLIFMGTPDFAVPTLLELVGQGHDVIACYSRAPAPAGRGMELRRSPVHEQADALGIPVFHPVNLKSDEEKERFAALEADAAVVVAYGMILPKAILEAPEHGCYNLHASLLPRWRGAAPINRAIMAGDEETGVMVMKMARGLDTGPVAMAERLAITDTMTAKDAHDRLARLGADLMARAMAALSRGLLTLTEQEKEGVTYAEKIAKAEAKIDWGKPAFQVLRHIHGLSPFPGAWTEFDAGAKRERLKVLRVEPAEGSGAPGALLDGHRIACGHGAVKLIEVQRAGKQPMDMSAFLNGAGLTPGSVLGGN